MKRTENCLAKLERNDYILVSAELAKQNASVQRFVIAMRNGTFQTIILLLQILIRISMKHLFSLYILSLLFLGGSAQQPKTFADRWHYVGIAVEESGYCIWGCSPIIGTDGKIHLFVERWPGTNVEPGWRGESEIAHYIGEKPEGPFLFSDLALTGTGKTTWDKCAVHNPTIHKVGDQYLLFYIGNDNPKQPPHPSNQRIGIAVSKSLYGPWERVGTDGKILSPPDDPKYWNYNASNGVNNPAFLQNQDGGYFLYLKSQGGKTGGRSRSSSRRSNRI